MRTTSQRADRRRVRAISFALCALAATGAGVIEAGVPGRRFQIDAHVVPQQAAHTGAGMDLQATLSADRSSLVGDSYSLSAGVIESPSDCASDTIFADGFDP